RARGRASADARRGREDVQRHPRADPPDREPVAEEASVAGRGAEAPRRRVAGPSTPGPRYLKRLPARADEGIDAGSTRGARVRCAQRGVGPPPEGRLAPAGATPR